MLSKLWINSTHLLLDRGKVERTSRNDEPTSIATTRLGLGEVWGRRVAEILKHSRVSQVKASSFHAKTYTTYSK